ncbi:MAG: hypothetical protein FJ042_00045 [Candidatus Cloacimonetes bacterium]|nr:hypothetical protein [Candidatus Cloacimonadota bacterium]
MIHSFKTMGLILMLLFVIVQSPAQLGSKTEIADQRVEKVLKQSGWKYSIDDDGDFELLFDTENGRDQLVWIRSHTEDLSHLEIREIWSFAYTSKRPFSADIANRLLEHNSQMKLGFWQVKKFGDKYTAVYTAQIAAESDLTTLRTVVNAVVKTADQMELELTDSDEF